MLLLLYKNNTAITFFFCFSEQNNQEVSTNSQSFKDTEPAFQIWVLSHAMQSRGESYQERESSSQLHWACLHFEKLKKNNY